MEIFLPWIILNKRRALLNIFRTKSYLKDYAKIKLSDKHYTKYISYLGALISSVELPPEALNHSLHGKYKDYKEFHISGDVLVVYIIEDNFLKLVRIGTHSQIFN